MRHLIILYSIACSLSACAIAQVDSDAEPVSHKALDILLMQYVDDEGMVAYAGLQRDSHRLNDYLLLLGAHHPNASWTENERLAYWLNAYNAWTLQLIIRHYPVESIKDITPLNIPRVVSAWDIPFIHIEGQVYDLNDLEHGIIRQRFDDPRIHFALVCAAISCPKLRREAYVAERLDDQLDEQAAAFINDQGRNRIKAGSVRLSKIFSWYGGDFTVQTDLITYLNRYAKVKIDHDARIDYLDYDWSLNEQ